MNKRPPENDDQNRIEHILHRLTSNKSGAAWAAFIECYSPLIMRAVHQFEFEQERQDDCFLHICEKLCQNDFRRLQKFNTRGSASFRTWLTSVVYNLCVDWHRKEYGRAIMLPAISALPMFDQAVYRLYFEQAIDLEGCRRTLEEEFPGLTAEQLSESIARVHALLTPRQRWRIAIASHKRRSVSIADSSMQWVADRESEPDITASRDEVSRQVRQALTILSPQQRLLVQLRYEQGLTLKKIAELMNLDDPFRARREIRAALDKLAAALQHLEARHL